MTHLPSYLGQRRRSHMIFRIRNTRGLWWKGTVLALIATLVAEVVLFGGSMFAGQSAHAQQPTPTATPRGAIPPLPHIFAGTATVNGMPVPDGFEIVARVLNYESLSVTVQGGKYSVNHEALLVGPPDDTFRNQTITFHLGDVQADQTAVFMPARLQTKFSLMFPSLPAIQEPELINNSLNLDNLHTSYDPTPVDGAPGGVFTIAADFTNTSNPTSFSDVFFEVMTLEGPGCPCAVLNAVGGPGGVGATISVGDVAAGQSFTATFEIGLTERARFEFFVDAFGVPGD